MAELEFPETKLRDVRIAAMNMLARREHSCAELKRKLQTKSYPKNLIETVVEQLRAENLQNDSRFTESYIRFRVQKGFGPIKIQHELKERGVDEDLIQVFLDMSDERWDEAAEEARAKRFGVAVPEDPKEKAKQARFLQYRGYGHSHMKALFSRD
ncbi:MAG: recombination regulator RecX [Gammaproteobacteria bacterium]|nr:recombination regulator RecX [Gammaproteobacteria bacterium]MDH5800579.1 recombination regulator RecX [Gammaproteobacteria bacterium]